LKVRQFYDTVSTGGFGHDVRVNPARDEQSAAETSEWGLKRNGH
jgi:hypothetical protein